MHYYTHLAITPKINTNCFEKGLCPLPVFPLPAFIYKVESSSHKQGSAEDAGAPAVVVASRLTVTNGPAAIEVNPHGIEKAEDG